MRKNVFRKIAQSICIGAIGLLAGTSLDYAYSGYGMLNNPNLWAESTTTQTTGNKVYKIEKKVCFTLGVERDHYIYSGGQFVFNDEQDEFEGQAERCSTDGTFDLCTPTEENRNFKYCYYYYYSDKNGVQKVDRTDSFEFRP